MPIVEGSHKVPLSLIDIPERRRKKKGDIEELANNISRHGLLHPITLRRKGERFILVAGERRLLAHQKLRASTVEARFLDELDEFESAALEWEENARRLDMDWREDAEAVAYYHELRKSRDSEWDMEMTGDCLGMSDKAVSIRCTIFKALRTDAKKFENIETLTAAYNLVQRERQRGVDAEAVKFLSNIAAGLTPQQAIDKEQHETLPPEAAAKAMSGMTYRYPLLDIRNTTFQDYLAVDLLNPEGLHHGKRFNMIHCDFPYGIDFHKSEQGGMAKWGNEGSYQDDPELFRHLCEQLRDNLPSIMEATGGHIFFWFPMAEYEQVRNFWQAVPHLSVNPVPCIWVKADGTGILPDAQRGPRRVYEAAFLMTYGDRPIVQAVANAITHPAAKDRALHPSEKPFQVVSHFLRMLVDETTKLLDPTCGSGTAVAAAEQLGACEVTGVEPNKEHTRTARHQLEKVRIAALVK